MGETAWATALASKACTILIIHLAREHQMTFDEEALTYLALAAETRLRSLLTSSLSAQFHRTTSSHTRAPPTSKSSGQPMWSHVAVADSNAVLEALSRENKDAEQSFRASRMDRIAREAEMQRAKERAERIVAASNADGAEEEGAGGSDGGQNGQASGSGVSTPAKASSSGNSPPVFGAVSERKTGSGRKSGKKAARDVSAEVAHKMSNATAMRNAGIFNKKQYSWMTSVPPVSSPLAGKKRKEGEGEGEQANGQAPEDDASLAKKGKKRDKGDKEGDQPIPRKRPRLTAPTRREVVVARDASGAERKMMDDQVLTMEDVIFALEREGVGKGMGTTDEIVMRARVLGDAMKSKDAAKR